MFLRVLFQVLLHFLQQMTQSVVCRPGPYTLESMMEEEEIEEESCIGSQKDVVLHLATRDPSVVCVDSGANILILKARPNRAKNGRAVLVKNCA